MSNVVNTDEFYNGILSMQRLRLKIGLIHDCHIAFCDLAEKKNVSPKSFRRQAERSIKRDFRKGLKQIDKKVPVYFELPKYESVGNGMWKEVDSKTNEAIDNEVKISECLQPNEFYQQIEQDMKQVIEYSEE